MFYLGMDVAKAKLDCCLLLDESASRRKTKVVNNTKSGIVDLLAMECQNKRFTGRNCMSFMEATGIYHEQAALALTDAGITVSIINPAQIKDFGARTAVRTKTDGVDSFVLARYGALLQPAAWQPPPPEARMLQALLARRDCHRPRLATRAQPAGKSRCHRHAGTDTAIPCRQHRVSGQTTGRSATGD